jgi:hypothetical protein
MSSGRRPFFQFFIPVLARKSPLRFHSRHLYLRKKWLILYRKEFLPLYIVLVKGKVQPEKDFFGGWAKNGGSS